MVSKTYHWLYRLVGFLHGFLCKNKQHHNKLYKGTHLINHLRLLLPIAKVSKKAEVTRLICARGKGEGGEMCEMTL